MDKSMPSDSNKIDQNENSNDNPAPRVTPANVPEFKKEVMQEREVVAENDSTVLHLSNPRSERRIGQVGQLESTYGTAHPCAQCSHSYKKQSQLMGHIWAKHKKQPKKKSTYGTVYHCGYCSASFKKLNSLRCHIWSKHREHNDMPLKQNVGDVCGQAFLGFGGKTSIEYITHGKKANHLTPTKVVARSLTPDSPNNEMSQHLEVTIQATSSFDYGNNQNCQNELPENMDTTEIKPEVQASTVKPPENFVVDQAISSYREVLVKSENEVTESHVEEKPQMLPNLQVQQPGALVNKSVFAHDSKRIEKSRLPFSTAIIIHSNAKPADMLIIWCDSLEDDLLTAVTLNKNNTIYCIQTIDYLAISNEQREILKNATMMNFIIPNDSGACSIWTIITFNALISPSVIKNKSFNSFAEVEKIFSEQGGLHGMETVNMMRSIDNGFISTLLPNLTKKIVICNCSV